MAESFTPEVSDRICRHMNDDHADVVLLYARTFGKAIKATAAKMLSIDAQGMDLLTQINGTEAPCPD
jgi:putative heme iron utilization protein